MTDNIKCVKCEAEMEEGFIPEVLNTGGFCKSFWGTGFSGTIFKKIDNRHDIRSYRCVSCGYLENYAK